MADKDAKHGLRLLEHILWVILAISLLFNLKAFVFTLAIIGVIHLLRMLL